MRKIAIVVGTRPNFIKITQFESEFNRYPDQFEYRLIHTGQHYDKQMSDVFFEQFGLKKPDLVLSTKGRSPADQIARIISDLSKYFGVWRPDLLIVVGDVNSTLAAAIAGNKCGIPLAHLESGLRSFDRNMPEEINRVLTDTLADIYFVTERSGIENLNRESNCLGDIEFVGNTMIDTLVAFSKQIDETTVLETAGIQGPYTLMTMHRPQNVDGAQNLRLMVDLIREIANDFEIVFPMHPRTLKNLENMDMKKDLENIDSLTLTGPLNYLSFQKLIKESSFVITDSGGIQEETTFRQVPCLTLRPNTERPSTTQIGSNTLLNFEKEALLNQIELIKTGTYKKGQIPTLWDGRATSRIVDFLVENL